MSVGQNQDSLIQLGDGYTVTQLSSLECSLIFRDPQDQVLAIMPGCQNKINAVREYKGHRLTAKEKLILQKMIRERQMALGEAAAIALGMSILRYAGGREEYVSERALKRRLIEPLEEVEYLFVGALHAASLHLPAYSRGAIYNLSHAQVKKLHIGENCDLQIDLRDNAHIAEIYIGNSYNGSLNASRSTVEYLALADNCHCDLTMFESRKCFRLQIGDVYSGNLHLKNSCFHHLHIGYYSYANIKLSVNWGRRDIAIGDSFRGVLDTDNVNISGISIGKDCKGVIKIGNTSPQNNCRKISIGEDFAGVLDLQGENVLQELVVGQRASGKFYLWGKVGVRQASLGAYFSGQADFSGSELEYLFVDEGSSGEVILQNCPELKLVKMRQYQNLHLQSSKPVVQTRFDTDFTYYYYMADIGAYNHCQPLYQKLYHQLRHAIRPGG